MYKFIKNTPTLNDIKSLKAREHFDLMVTYLCSSLVPNEYPELLELNGITLEKYHEYLAPILYSHENQTLANSVLKNRTEISDGEMIDGFASIYDLKREIILELDSRKYFESVAVMEHELIHILQALNNNNPEAQYNEVLSFFGEFLSAKILSQKSNNEDIFKNLIIRRCINRMSFRVFTKEFTDETFEKKPDSLKEMYLSSYNYMLGYIYGVRIFELYYLYPDKVLIDFNLVLNGKKSITNLLQEYKISLENKEVVFSFKKMVNLYRTYVDEKYNREDLHRV